ncbi:lipocalin-like domain-containing protein [Bosea caraganae]|uniref:lipocalin-like domain-containing protein n=1 Tax=Bosea caraganae TaxID=2763117 RepID=UPI0011C054BA|nr:lipocalin-like domain-containing protein [Bosea caraganae]
MSIERRSVLKSAAAAIAVTIPGTIAGRVPQVIAAAPSNDPLVSLILRCREASEAFNRWARSPEGWKAGDAEYRAKSAAMFEALQDELGERPPMPTTPEGAALALEEFTSYSGTYDLEGDAPLLQIVISYLRGAASA